MSQNTKTAKIKHWHLYHASHKMKSDWRKCEILQEKYLRSPDSEVFLYVFPARLALQRILCGQQIISY